MSDLDESLSDVTPRKKCPFELQKALHNVMFIQHHIQRQDEFNAVRILTNLTISVRAIIWYKCLKEYTKKTSRYLRYVQKYAIKEKQL